MGWPNNFVQGVYDSSGNVIGIDGIGSLIQSHYEKLARLEANPVGFNYFSAVYEIIAGLSGPDLNGQLAYIASTGANIVRIGLPVFGSAGEYLTLVHNTAEVPSTVSEDTYRTTYLAALDTVFNACAANGLKIHLCDFWLQSYLPSVFTSPETKMVAYGSTTSQTAIYMKSAIEFIVNRYSNHTAWGLYSIGNEWGYDETGAVNPTSTQLGAFFTFIANAGRAVNKNIIVTTDLLFQQPVTQWLIDRPLIEGYTEGAARAVPYNLAKTFHTIFAGLDAYCFHIYEDTIFAGRGNADNNNASLLVTAANVNIGFEGLESLLANMVAIAKAKNKPLIIGEVGLATTQESVSAVLKNRRMLNAITKYSSFCCLWNVQDATTGAGGYGGGQAIWYITPGTGRGNTYLAIAKEYNKGKHDNLINPVAGTYANKHKIAPKSAIKCANSATGYLTCASSLGLSTLTNPSVMFWVRIDSALSANEIIADFRIATGFGGFAVLGSSSAATGIRFIAKNAGGTDVDIGDIVPTLNMAEWNHIAFIYETINGLKVATVWLNGLYWKSVIGTGTNVGIADTTNLILGGVAGNGAPVSFQDYSISNQSSYQDIQDHMQGKVLPQSLVHLRAFKSGTFENIIKSPVNVFTNAGAVTIDIE